MEVATQLLTKWANRVDTVAGTYTVIGSIAEFWDSVVVIPDLRDQKLCAINPISWTPYAP